MSWSFTQHACRACMGTILQSGSEFTCSMCRAMCKGVPHLICGCGAEIIGPVGRRPAGLRCVENPSPTPQNPSRVLIAVIPPAAL
jgi:hypothetical protein